jgi:hypothetical protein
VECSVASSLFIIMLFNHEVSLLIFLSKYLYIGESGVLKSPTIFVLRSIYTFMSYRFYFIKLSVLTFHACMFITVIFYWWIAPFTVWSKLYLFWLFWFEVCFVRYEHSYSSLLLCSISFEYLFISFYMKPVLVFSQWSVFLVGNKWVSFCFLI